MWTITPSFCYRMRFLKLAIWHSTLDSMSIFISICFS